VFGFCILIPTLCAWFFVFCVVVLGVLLVGWVFFMGLVFLLFGGCGLFLLGVFVGFFFCFFLFFVLGFVFGFFFWGMFGFDFDRCFGCWVFFFWLGAVFLVTAPLPPTNPNAHPPATPPPPPLTCAGLAIARKTPEDARPAIPPTPRHRKPTASPARLPTTPPPPTQPPPTPHPTHPLPPPPVSTFEPGPSGTRPPPPPPPAQKTHKLTQSPAPGSPPAPTPHPRHRSAPPPPHRFVLWFWSFCVLVGGAVVECKVFGLEVGLFSVFVLVF